MRPSSFGYGDTVVQALLYFYKLGQQRTKRYSWQSGAFSEKKERRKKENSRARGFDNIKV
jgi:hypothetical protein